MLRRPGRPTALLVPALLIPALAACGSDGSDDVRSVVSSVEVTGEVGEEPQVEWTEDVDATGDIEVEVLEEGDGVELEDDSPVLVQYLLSNGFDESTALSTYADAAPEVLDLGSGELPEVFSEALSGRSVGDRVAVGFESSELFGEVGNAALNINNKDPLLLVMDVMGPTPVDVPYAEEGEGIAPDLVLGDDGLPESMLFKGIPKPTGELQVETVVEGGGPVVRKGDSVMVDYLGSVYAKPKPFDSSFGDTPIVGVLGQGGFVDGWIQGLSGQTVGSRVWLAIPPELGYGAEGNESAKIKGTDTIYFLVDILGVAPRPAAADEAERAAQEEAEAELGEEEPQAPSPAVSEEPSAPGDTESPAAQ
ncbi:MAG: FKBP-type peptidyl-prolyl cis-trans isomerase [Nocardioides marinisabuli]|uniref:FKBP-type peptidyl-prolyl cis-trans isomerase n=1 Tax=Nocardioides marinisabuli TaxID=419476 RepID=UPI00321ACA61